MIPLSVLDLAPVAQGSTPALALRNTLDLAQRAERLGYHRFWLAEHHGMPGVASAATSVVIGYVAGGTTTIRVGAGGIMLPNHSPLMIAEQFGTLESLYPGRIDLGLGRAPGSDSPTIRALRRAPEAADRFPQDVLELMGYFAAPGSPDGGAGLSRDSVMAVPGAGLTIPLWILGSSLFGAQMAAAYGLPYAFASHFAPTQLMEAIRVYRERFQPSAQLQEPYLMLGVNVVAAPTDEEARTLFSSIQQMFLSLRKGRPGQLPPPVEGFEAQLNPLDRMMLEQALSCAVVGSEATVREGLERFIEQTGANELMITGQVYDHVLRMRSFEMVARSVGLVAGPPAGPMTGI